MMSLYGSSNLVNLVAELERRVAGRSPTQGLRDRFSTLIPDQPSYLLLIVDGLGASQLNHPNANTLRKCYRATLKAPFPTTTPVGLSSLSTAMTPLQHGVIGYHQYLPHLRRVVNLKHWTDQSGQRLDIDLTHLLPSPNLWERLSMNNVSARVYLPEDLIDSPLSRMLFRGADKREYRSSADISLSRSGPPSTRALTVVYSPGLDSAAHACGQQSQAYSQAMNTIAHMWKQLCRRLPSGTTLVGTADHGHCDIFGDSVIALGEDSMDGLSWSGDWRTLMLTGPNATNQAAKIASQTGAEQVSTQQLRRWLGQGKPHPELHRRLPDTTLIASPGTALYPPGTQCTIIGHHGGTTPAEILIPLLVSP